MSTVDQSELKQAIKEAITEVVRENKELVGEILAEVLDDIALLRRMEEGRQTELVGREEIMELLEPKR